MVGKHFRMPHVYGNTLSDRLNHPGLQLLLLFVVAVVCFSPSNQCRLIVKRLAFGKIHTYRDQGWTDVHAMRNHQQSEGAQRYVKAQRRV